MPWFLPHMNFPFRLFKRINEVFKLSVLIVAAGISSFAFAEEKKPWDVSVDLGAIRTSGNTDTTTVQAKVDAKQNLQQWENEYILNSLYKKDQVVQDDGTEETQTTAEKYLASVKSNYILQTEKSYLFGFASYANDKFGAYRTYSTVALGYGDWLYSTPTLTWFVEAGPGYFRGDQVIENPDPTLPDTLVEQSGAILRAASTLVWKVTETAEFKQVVSVESGSDNTRTLSETSLATTISERLQLKVGFTVANDTDVAPGKEKTDTTTFVNLVYHL